jgi:hypothetical protein
MPHLSDSIDRLLTYMRRIGDVMPRRYSIDRHQKLLIMYRALLAEYLRQHQQWARTEVPGFLSAGISTLRAHILETKAALRGWKVAIDDHPDDQSPDNDIGSAVEHQRNLLRIHRTTLAAYLSQKEQLKLGQAPPIVINSIQHSRSEIQRIKAILRGWGVAVDDLPEEEVE